MSQQQVQPVDVYPSPNVIQPRHSSHSNGSFGPVFIVLGVIVALTIVATVLGRICGRRRHGSKADHHQPRHANGGGGKKKAPAGKSVRPHDNKFQAGPEGDIEFGFDKRIATSKVADHRGDPRGPKPWHNGEPKGHVRFADDHIDFKPGP